MHCELRIPPLQGVDLLCNLTSYMAFQHGQIWARVLKASWYLRQVNAWETLLALQLRCPALQNENEGNFLFFLQVCLHLSGRCFSAEEGPVTMEDVPSIWSELEVVLGSAPAANREFDIHQGLSAVREERSILPVSLTPRCYWMFRLDIRKKNYSATRTVKHWSRSSSTVFFLLRCAPWSTTKKDNLQLEMSPWCCPTSLWSLYRSHSTAKYCGLISAGLGCMGNRGEFGYTAGWTQIFTMCNKCCKKKLSFES